MEKIDGDTLKMFAMANGLAIMQHRNADEWAEKINKNGGLCPCGKECPCADCTCKFYEQATTNNNDEIETNTNEEKTVDDSEEEHDELKSMDETVAKLSEIQSKLMKIEPDNKEETIKVISEAEKTIENDIEAHQCSMCKDMLGGISRKLGFLKGECKEGGITCNLEIEDTVERIAMMGDIFRNAKSSITEEPVEEQENAETEPTLVEPEKPLEQCDSGDTKDTKPVAVGYSDFHDCVKATVASEELQEVSRNDRLCVAAKSCGRSRMSIDEAKEECGGK